MSHHVFSLEASWSGGVAGRGHVRTGGLDADVSVPSVLGGPGCGTNPEELVLAAAASCYLVTLAAICQRRELPVTGITLSSHVRVTSPPALKVIAIVHRPVLTFAGEANDATRAALLDAAQRAEEHCMVSNALRGNVTVSVDPTLVHEPR